MSAPAVRGPHDVPNLRLYLLEQWRVGGVYETAARIRFDMSGGWRGAFGWRPREEAEWERGHLRDCPLWWVSEEMVDEISHVAAELPDDVSNLDVPGLVVADGALNGLVVLAKPMAGLDAASTGKQVTVDAFLFGGTRLPPVYGKPMRYAASVAAYRRVNYDDGLRGDEMEASLSLLLAEQELTGGHPGADRQVTGPRQPDGGLPVTYSLHGEEWTPLGRSDWPLGRPLCEKVDDTVDDVAHASMMEDRRWLAALHLVAADIRVATVRRERPATKPQRRPSERKKIDPTVRVVYLRKLAHERQEATEGHHSGRRAPRAHVVRSHPRWQAWGPDRSLRKLILVPRHARGGSAGEPPTEGPPTVKAVVR